MTSNTSTIYSFRVKNRTPLWNYLEDYSNAGNDRSEHIRSVMQNFMNGESEMGLRHFEAMVKSSKAGQLLKEWCRENMSERHWDLMNEYVRERMQQP